MTFIFVHIPKTAGTSFRKAAKQSLNCAWDYGLGSPETSQIFRETIYNNKPNELSQQIAAEDIDLVSGHFKADKYKDLVPNGQLIAFVRDPLSRLISEYNHHVRHGGYPESIESYCNEPGHQDRQHKCFSGLSIADFYFVGVTERYSKSLQLFNEISGLSLKEMKTNRATENVRNDREVSKNSLSDELVAQIHQQNAKDFALYNRALQQIDSFKVAA